MIYLLRSRKLIFKVLHGSIRYFFFSWKKYGKAKSWDVSQHPMPTSTLLIPTFQILYIWQNWLFSLSFCLKPKQIPRSPIKHQRGKFLPTSKKQRFLFVYFKTHQSIFFSYHRSCLQLTLRGSLGRTEITTIIERTRFLILLEMICIFFPLPEVPNYLIRLHWPDLDINDSKDNTCGKFFW